MNKIVIYIAYNLFKNLSIRNKDYLGKGYIFVSMNIACHLLALLKLIGRVEIINFMEFNRATLYILALIFILPLSYLFSYITSRRYLNICISKYKKNELLYASGGLVFVGYCFINLYFTYRILVDVISIFSYIKFIILPLSFYIYCKTINKNNKQFESQ